MKKIPSTNDTLVLRTEFRNEEIWTNLCQEIIKPNEEGFIPYVEFYSNTEFEGITKQEILSGLPEDYDQVIMFIVDNITIEHPDHPVLCLDLIHVPGRTFRVIPSEMWSVENNLSIANMDFEEFYKCIDEEGIFRGF
jgi:hypothetical protein